MSIIERVLRDLRKALGIKSLIGPTMLSKAYSVLLDALAFGRGIPRCINGEPVVWLDPACRFLDNSYEPEVCTWLKAHIKPGDVVLDVGAQIGLYAIFFARWVGEGGRVVAFDPSPDAQKLMQRHVRENRLGDRISLVGSAVGAEDGMAVFQAAGADAQNSLVSRSGDTVRRKSIQVPISRLDSYCSSHQIRPNVIKIDTEGWELPILRGAGQLLRDESITWVVEMHPYAWTDAGYTRADFEALLREYRLEVVPLTGQDDPLATYGDTFLRRVSAPAA